MNVYLKMIDQERLKQYKHNRHYRKHQLNIWSKNLKNGFKYIEFNDIHVEMFICMQIKRKNSQVYKEAVFERPSSNSENVTMD